MSTAVPVVLFAYNRPGHLARTLASLRAGGAPRLIAYSDAPRRPADAPAVEVVRAALRAVDWCPLDLRDRPVNLGNGRSIREGVAEVLAEHGAAIVFEDDLECAPGAYEWLAAALANYRDDGRVMSVSGWTHPRVLPAGLEGRPYFDGRCATLGWGTWARAWEGMDRDARALWRACEARGIDPARYGLDLSGYAEEERARNIWAVRFILLHLLRGGLCLCPPWPMVAHRGYDGAATNAATDEGWADPPLRARPPLPATWPRPEENPDCARLWREATRARAGLLRRIAGRARRVLAGAPRGAGSR